MKTLIILLFASLLLSCSKIDKEAPKCLNKKIKENQKGNCDDANVEEYLFQGKTVYVLGFYNCASDGAAEVVDSDCNRLGYLGGIEGNTKINGEPFSNAVYVKTVWEK